jgi:hypothetical protein
MKGWNLTIPIFIFFDSKLEYKRFCTKWQQAFPDFNDSPVLMSFMWEPNIFLSICVSPATELDSKSHITAGQPCGEPDHPAFRPRVQISQNNTHRQINIQSWHSPAPRKPATESLVSPARPVTEMCQEPSRDSSVARLISVWWDQMR